MAGAAPPRLQGRGHARQSHPRGSRAQTMGRRMRCHPHHCADPCICGGFVVRGDRRLFLIGYRALAGSDWNTLSISRSAHGVSGTAVLSVASFQTTSTRARSCCRSNDAGALARAASSIAISAPWVSLARRFAACCRCSRRRYPMRPKPIPDQRCRVAEQLPVDIEPVRSSATGACQGPAQHVDELARTAIIAIAPGYEIVHPVQRVHDLGRGYRRAAWTAHRRSALSRGELLGLPVGHAVR